MTSLASDAPDWIVTVLSANKVSAGIHVAPGWVVTVAHGVPEGSVIDIVFPFVPEKRNLTARLIRAWRDQTVDVAVIRIAGDEPSDEAWLKRCSQPRLVWPATLAGHAYAVFGHPVGSVAGGWSHGVVTGLAGSQHLQLMPDPGRGYAIEEGFSGGALWDEELKSVIGMVIGYDRKTKIAFAVTSGALSEKLAEAGAELIGARKATPAHSRTTVAATNSEFVDAVLDRDPMVSLPAALAFGNAGTDAIRDLAGRLSGYRPVQVAARIAFAQQPEVAAPIMAQRVLLADRDWHRAVKIPPCFGAAHAPYCTDELTQALDTSEPDPVRLSILSLGYLAASSWAFKLDDLFEHSRKYSRFYHEKYQPYLVLATAQLLAEADQPFWMDYHSASLERMVKSISENNEWQGVLWAQLLDAIVSVRPWHADLMTREWAATGCRELRHLTVHALGQMRLTRGRSVLVRALEDSSEDPEIRRDAALGLANIGGEDVPELLLQVATTSDNRRVVDSAKIGLAFTLFEAPEELIDRALSVLESIPERGWVHRSLGLRADSGRRAVVAAGLAADTPAERGQAAIALARMEGASVAQTLRRAHDEAGSVQERICTSLALLLAGDGEHDPHLAKLRADLAVDSYMYKRPIREDIVGVLGNAENFGGPAVAKAWQQVYEQPVPRLPDY